MPADAPTLAQLLAQVQAGGVPLTVLIGHAERLRSAGGAGDAATIYEAWLARGESAGRGVALFNWGVLLADLGRLDAAEAAYREAFAHTPQLHQARINAGLVLERKKDDVGAVTLWMDVATALADAPAGERALATIALNHVGRLQESRRQYAAAEAALAKSLELNPNQPDAIQHWVHLRQKQCSWPVYSPPPALRVNALVGATSPLATLALFDDPAMQWLSALSFVRRKYALPETRPAAPAAARKPPERLRIGYLSGDLCTHAVGLLMTELVESHDRGRFHVSAFDFSPEDGTEHRARLKRAFDEFVDVRGLDDRAAAEVIRSGQIDVLIDLHGLSSGARPGILALAPAPRIATYLGFIGTTALPCVDAYITDRFTLPETLTPYFTERPLYIDGSMIPLHHGPVTTGRLKRADLGLPETAFVMASFNNVYKITPEIFACWMRILHRVDDAVLWLLDDNPWATAALRSRAAEAGVAPDRVIFAGRCPHAEYRERLALADLYLDTYPYNAGSTARDVLDADVPMVTWTGRTPVSRMAGSMLHAAGLDALLTTSEVEYEELAVRLASEPDALEAIRRAMGDGASARASAPGRLVRSLEAQLLAWCGLTAPAPPAAPG